ncbi:Pentatricopeptide repeat (PPR) superfamily protein [Arabidopsis thaliana]|uniref:Pentatricopeptide repeat (PPR) superfamily protein n=1 Tax=Arabidopsis thaliana TaxID=3702 RepID=A0A1P8BF21_ARATH|nr:Pentatricopeptide repeat (PPR) superfamily protein [Arabidopsis thaliana]ANM70184.1 Pentatricopeptide repeat (PPR) superfamily protein [Arabidopsis thaliana]|eukprot:NP_001331814.1 Pentatricopeptide repeat (PPR) superfamily protein [Arabidopsis thaliana]
MLHMILSQRVILLRKYHSSANALVTKSPNSIPELVKHIDSDLIRNAHKVFDEIPELDVISATAVIGRFVKESRHVEASQAFKRLLCLGIRPNEFTFGTVIGSSTTSRDVKLVIGGFSQTGRNEEAVNTFVDMLREGVVIPNESTFPCAITAISNIASHGAGKSIHACAIKFLGKRFNVFVWNSLISFYSKCGNMEDSLLAFNKLEEEQRNIVSWNSMIWGYAHNGRGEEAVAMFEKMVKDTNLRPNNVTILGVLFACNHAGLIQEGYMYFNKAVNDYDDPNLLELEHYACMVDMLSRSGRFKEAEELIKSMPLDPGIGFWKALLGGCQIHSNKRLAKLAASKILELDPRDVSSYVMLSNAYSAMENWQNVSLIRRKMKETGLKRFTGCSWIEVRDQIRVFVNADKNNELKDEVYRMLALVSQHLEENECWKDL